MKFENPEVEAKYQKVLAISQKLQPRSAGMASTKEELLELCLEIQRFDRGRGSTNSLEESADVLICVRWFLDTVLSDLINNMDVEKIISEKLDKWERQIYWGVEKNAKNTK